MSLFFREKRGIYNGLLWLLVLMLPVPNLAVIRFGFRDDFHDSSELTLFLLYATPLWLGLAIMIGFEIYRRIIMEIPPTGSMIYKMTLAGFAVPVLLLLICPVGPRLWSVNAGVLILFSAVNCGVWGMLIYHLLRIRQRDLRQGNNNDAIH